MEEAKLLVEEIETLKNSPSKCDSRGYNKKNGDLLSILRVYPSSVIKQAEDILKQKFAREIHIPPTEVKYEERQGATQTDFIFLKEDRKPLCNVHVTHDTPEGREYIQDLKERFRKRK